MSDLQKAVDEIWMAVSFVIESLRDAGADEGRLSEAIDHLELASDLLRKANP